MGVPINDIALSNKPVAFMISGINTLKVIKLSKIHEGFFVDKDYGIFMVDSTFARPLMYGKQPLYFYDVRSAKPIDMLMMKELDEFVRENGLTKIHEKHVRHGEKLRQKQLKIRKDQREKQEPLTDIEIADLALQELDQDENNLQDDITKQLDIINDGINKENEKLLAAQKPPLEVTPEDYTTFVLERLTLKGLITREDALKIRSRLGTGISTLDDFARELESLHKVEINRPISTNAQNFLEHYRTFPPSGVLSYIVKAMGLGKDIKDLGQPVIKNLVPIKWILLGCIGVGIMAIMLTSIDFRDFGNLIPFFNR